MTKIDSIYIDHIMESISRIERYLIGIDQDSFLNNEMVQSAVIRELEVIGEASKNISKKTKDMYERVPWRSISGMKDKLIHDYMGVDLDAVWDTATIDILELKTNLSRILNMPKELFR